MWNKGEPIAFSKKWNPFNNDIPFLTFTSHPLLWHKGELSDFSDLISSNLMEAGLMFLSVCSCFLIFPEASTQVDCKTEKPTISYDVETLSQQLPKPMESLGKLSKDIVQQKPILLHNYLSLGSLIHNRNSLGFFKVRGRFSF